MKLPQGLALAKDLIAKSDVVVENYRPGVAARIGLNIQEIRAGSPGLIWASVSGFGQNGPLSDRPAYDMIVQALSGVMSLTGEPGRRSEEHTSELQSLMRISYAVFCLTKTN